MAQTNDSVAKLNELIKDIDFAMLTTIRTNGSLHSCPMATQQVDTDGIIWFFSHINTEKVEAIRTDPRVNLAYSDADSQRYVSITGRCELVRDHVKAKQLWKPVYETLNLSRDQMDRAAEIWLLARRWREAIAAAPDCHVVANADDPLIAWVAAEAPDVTWVA